MPTLRLVALCRRLAAVVLGFASVTASAMPPARSIPALTADQSFAAHFGDEFLDAYWAYNPDTAVAQGYYRYADRLLAPTPAERQRYGQWLTQQLAALERIPVAQLSEGPRTDWTLLHNQLAFERWQLQALRNWQWNPALYNVAEPIELLLAARYAADDQRLRAISARLAAVPAYYRAAQASLLHPTRQHTALAIQQSGGVLETLGRGLEDRVAGSALNAAERTRFLQRLRAARAAVRGYIEALKALDADQAQTGSARDFRLGKALYETKFAYEIASGSTGEQLYQRALLEKEKLHARMSQLADQLWPKYFPDRAPPGDRVEKIAVLIARLSERHTTAEGFVDEVKRQIPQLEAFVRDHQLLTLDPSRPLSVRETPLWQRGFSMASINAPGPYDPTAQTWYNVSPLSDYTPEQAESFLREYNHWQLQVLNIHEAVPGHYVQLLYANKSPSRIKAIFGNGAMVEGWAVYSEKMMLEAGWGGHEPEMELIYSKWSLRVVCNTILDYSLHVLGMNEAQALDLLRREAFQSETEARGKWRRATLSQVQLTSYFAGYSAIYDFRERLKAKLGSRFDLRRFHEAFLSYGSAPVGTIAVLMRPADAAAP